jgi:hypothetical protein
MRSSDNSTKGQGVGALSRAPFIILALPRSRTAWLSAFLSYPPRRCGHDIGAECSSVPDFLNRLAKLNGTVETGAVIGWQLIKRLIPEAQIIVVKRPVEEIKRSLAKFGITPVEGELEARRAMLDACGEAPGVTWIEYGELDDESVCRWIFETCLEREFDRKWHARLAKQNIQIDVLAQMARLALRRDPLERFKREIATAVAELDGVPCAA